MNTNSIDLTQKHDLCHSCGICKVVCPKNCISIRRDFNRNVPTIKKDDCINCGKCLEVCSGWKSNSLEGVVFSKPQTYLGNHLDSFWGYDLNCEARKKSASGGVLTAFLKYLFRNKIIQGAMITSMGVDGYPNTHLVHDEHDLEKARGSIYEVNDVSRAFEQICNSKVANFAIVALPCQLESISKAISLNKTLNKRNFIKISMCCGKVISHKGVDFLLSKIGKRRIDKFQYRKLPGWGVQFGTINHNIQYWFQFVDHGVFELNRCDLCSDFFARHADIVFGDAWLDKFKGNEKGVSLFLVRTEGALKFINKMREEGLIKAEPTTWQDILKSQSGNIFFKYQSMQAKTLLRNLGGGRTNYHIKIKGTLTCKTLRYALRKFLMIKLFSKKNNLPYLIKYEKFLFYFFRLMRKLSY